MPAWTKELQFDAGHIPVVVKYENEYCIYMESPSCGQCWGFTGHAVVEETFITLFFENNRLKIKVGRSERYFKYRGNVFGTGQQITELIRGTVCTHAATLNKEFITEKCWLNAWCCWCGFSSDSSAEHLSNNWHSKLLWKLCYQNLIKIILVKNKRSWYLDAWQILWILWYGNWMLHRIAEAIHKTNKHSKRN